MGATGDKLLPPVGIVLGTPPRRVGDEFSGNTQIIFVCQPSSKELLGVEPLPVGIFVHVKESYRCAEELLFIRRRLQNDNV
jgi:hypothetical protein